MKSNEEIGLFSKLFGRSVEVTDVSARVLDEIAKDHGVEFDIQRKKDGKLFARIRRYFVQKDR